MSEINTRLQDLSLNGKGRGGGGGLPLLRFSGAPCFLPVQNERERAED